MARELRWGIEQRLEFIEFRLFWDGGINRGDIVGQFGVSVPQASADLSRYQSLAPGNVEYDASAKRYVAASSFAPQFLTPDADIFFERLSDIADDSRWTMGPLSVDVARSPRRLVDAGILREIVKAVRGPNSVEILYQSMNPRRPDPVWRRITPHAFGFDGARWHTRAFCHLDQRFQDFLLPRTLGCRKFGPPGPLQAQDQAWNQYFDLKVAPNPKLSESQRSVVARDYAMVDGICSFSVRYAMLFYVLRKLGLLEDAERRDTRSQHIVLLNRAEAEEALRAADSSEDAVPQK